MINSRLKRFLAAGALFGATISPALMADDKKAATPDDRISDQVRMRLATDADVKGGALDVTVTNGEVVIKGRVDNERGKNKAGKLAKKVKGVKSVDNELVVGPPTT
jgi:osmotically-inducible protein OsmY